MTIKALYPTIKPSLLLDFANVKALDPRITFTRASTARYYDGKTVTKAEENLLLYSQKFDEAVWLLSAGFNTYGFDNLAPDGSSTALNADAVGSNETITQAVTVAAGEYTFSVWLRRVAGTGNVQITAHSGGTWVTQSITSSWARYTVTQTLTAGSRTPGVRIVAFADEIEIWGAQFEQRSAATAYTPTTTQIVRNFVPTLLTAAAGVARFDHNPVTGESLGLLIEEQRTNLSIRSEEINDAGWGKTGTTVSANAIIAPDGALTADRIVETTSTGSHRVASPSASYTSGTIYTASVFVKADPASVKRFFLLRFAGASHSATAAACFDLDLGTTTDVTTGNSASATITNVGNGWYRCVLTATADGTASATIIMQLRTTAGTTLESYTGDGTSGIFIWGAQLEAGAFPTSYIPTTSATVTRSADSAVMTGANFSSWYRADEGTLYSEASRPFAVPSGQFPRVFEISDGTGNNSIRNVYATDSAAVFAVTTGAVIQANLGPSVTVPLRKLAGAYKVDDFAASVNGGTVSTDTSGTIPVVDRAAIGSTGTAQFLNGHIRKIAYYTSRLANATLQAMTS